MPSSPSVPPPRRAAALAMPSLAALACALLLGVARPAPPEALAQEGAPPSATRWEYRIVSWTLDDTRAVLQAATGLELASIEEMAHALERESLEPLSDARVQGEVDRRLEARLSEVGREGWELVWVAEQPAVVTGVLLPAPRVYLRRRLP